MIEHELEKIKRSFVRAKGCCTEIACLLTIIKYYDGNETIESLSQWYIPESNQTLTALKQVAEHIGMTAYLCQLDMEQLDEDYNLHDGNYDDYEEDDDDIFGDEADHFQDYDDEFGL